MNKINKKWKCQNKKEWNMLVFVCSKIFMRLIWLQPTNEILDFITNFFVATNSKTVLKKINFLLYFILLVTKSLFIKTKKYINSMKETKSVFRMRYFFISNFSITTLFCFVSFFISIPVTGLHFESKIF